jgi:hypothetical protein
MNCNCCRIKITQKLSLDEILRQINSQFPNGILKADKNSLNQAILISKTKGKDAFINVSGEAGDLIFGTTNSATGVDPVPKGIDYQPLIDIVKSSLGYPLVPVELDDSQWKLIMDEAFNLYNKWRNDEEQVAEVHLKGTFRDGFEIPSFIEDQKKILDILFRSRLPFGFFGSPGFENTMATQMLLNGYARTGFMANGLSLDFHILQQYITDTQITMGTVPRWEILNNKIFIYPQLPEYIDVKLKYKTKITVEKALRDPIMIQKWACGKSLLILGMIRNTLNGGILEAGQTQINMNPQTMIAEGKQMMEEAEKLMRGETEPLSIIYG